MKNLMTIAIMLITITAFAQQGNRQMPTIEKRLERVLSLIEKNIEITETQKEAIEDAYTDFFTKTDQEMQSGKRPEKSVMEAYEKERDNKVKEVLSEEQYEKYLKISCKLKPKNPERGNGQRPPR